MGHGGNKETNLTVETSMRVNDFVRIVTSGSRNITLANLLASSVDELKSLGFITDVVDVRLRGVINISSNYGLLLTDDIVLVDSTGGNVTINLMLASAAWNATDEQGYIFTIKKTDSSTNKVILNTSGGDLIDGEPSIELIGIDRPYVHFVSDGSNWWTV